MGDSKFAESLELMAFLANLVGIQHIQRFVPLADPNKAESASGGTQTVEAPTVVRTAPHRARPAGDETTREMPRLKSSAPPPTKAASGAAAKAPAAGRAETKAPQRANPSGASKTPAPQQKASTKGAAQAGDLKSKIIADAVRLMKWGKPWHELAELIARIADRPSAGEIRKVLRAHRAEIEEKAGKT